MLSTSLGCWDTMVSTDVAEERRGTYRVRSMVVVASFLRSSWKVGFADDEAAKARRERTAKERIASSRREEWGGVQTKQ